MQQRLARLVWNCPTNDRYARLNSYFLLQSMACSSFPPHPGCKTHVFTWSSSDRSPILNLTAPFPLATGSGVASHLQLPLRGHNGVLCGHFCCSTEGQTACGTRVDSSGAGILGRIPGTLVKPCHLQPGRLHAVTRHMISQLDTRHPYSKKLTYFCVMMFLLGLENTVGFAFIC